MFIGSHHSIMWIRVRLHMFDTVLTRMFALYIYSQVHTIIFQCFINWLLLLILFVNRLVREHIMNLQLLKTHQYYFLCIYFLLASVVFTIAKKINRTITTPCIEVTFALKGICNQMMALLFRAHFLNALQCKEDFRVCMQVDGMWNNERYWK